MMIDTHCHLDIEDYEDVEEVVHHMDGNYMIASGASPEGNKRVLELVEKYPNIYGTIGLHPECASTYTKDDLLFVEENLNHPKIVGVGEIGLDYHYSDIDKEKQKELFIKQIKLAQKYHKTIVIHSRDAAMDTYDILKEYLHQQKAILHCYGYSKEMALRFKEFPIKFGIGGVVTFKNGRRLQETVEALDLEDLVLETDSPYLTPEPFRGHKNEPYNIYYVAKKIAQIKHTTLENVLKTTLSTSISQFDLKL